MKAQYPNLELLEYKVLQRLEHFDEFKERVAKLKTPHSFLRLEAAMFMQTWANTCLGFDVDKHGNAMWGGQAFTDAYTTVFHERTTDIYVVCFGDNPCYVVTDPTHEFFEDFNNHKMSSLSEAKKRYSNEQEKDR